MAGPNPGRNVGRLSIRVIPNTNDFRRDLKRRLESIERTTQMTVRVSKAKLDNASIRADIRRQMEEFKGLDAAVNVQVSVDKARLRKKALRKSIQDQFDEFRDIRVNIAAQIKNKEHFEKEVSDMVSRASRNQVKIGAAAHTLAASGQLAWVSRDRFVNLVVRVSKTSVTAALTTLAALSGARLSWQWIDNLATSMKNLDKNLPAILGWTTGITSLGAALFAATSGLVGIGQGLFTILPAFLVLPGLIMNAVGSATALIVALKNTSKELAPLKDDMSELGEIISTGFWTKARQPILDLVTGLMPQLRNSFKELSAGMGQFSGDLANAFAVELDGGRLESIFAGVAEGWRILSTGAPAFAGAMTSLAQIGAKYTPRLAQWFVRQANTFDTWLEAISNDGRLDGWMEGAIKSMYDLWDATTGIAGVFKGLWNAADASGSQGLAGFAAMMQTWERVVNGADFQRGLTAVFRGARVAMGAFGDAVRAIGRLVVDLDESFEKFIGSAGIFLGGLIEGAANALNQPSVDQGLLRLSDGLVRALEGVLPYLPTIGATFGDFLGLLGDLAGELLPAAAGVLAELMPSIDAVINAIKPVLPDLADAVSDIATTLGPPLAEFVTTAAPTLAKALVGIADTLVAITPAIEAVVNALTDIMRKLFPELGAINEYAKSEYAPDPAKFDNPAAYFDAYVKGAQEYAQDNPLFFTGYLEDLKWEDLSKWSSKFKETFHDQGRDAAQAMWDEFVAVAPSDVATRMQKLLEVQMIDLDWKGSTGVKLWKDQLESEFSSAGLSGAQAMWDEISAPMSGETKKKLLGELGDLGKLLSSNIKPDEALKFDAERLAGKIEAAFKNGTGSKHWLDEYLKLDPKVQSRVLEELGQFRDEAVSIIEAAPPVGGGGGGMSRQLAQGILGGLPELDASMRAVKDTIQRGALGSETWLAPSGALAMGGMKAGLDSGKPAITTDLAAMGGLLAGAMASSGSWLYGTGAATMGGMRAGAEAGRGSVVGQFSGLYGQIAGAMSGAGGWFFGVGIQMMVGVARGISAGGGVVAREARGVINRAVAEARAAAEIRSPSRRTNREIGRPLAQGVAVGIKRETAGIRRSMQAAVDFSGVTGTAPGTPMGAAGGRPQSSGPSLTIVNPVVRDLKREAWDAAQLLGVLT